MPSGMGATVANQVLDFILGGGTYTPGSTVYLALFLTPPTADGGGTEVSGAAYTRLALANDATTWSAAGSGSKFNLIAAIFPGAGNDWGTVVGAALMTAPTGGSSITFGTLDEAKPVHVGDVAQFAVNTIRITLL